MLFKNMRPLLDADGGNGGGAGDPSGNKDGKTPESEALPENFDDWLKSQPESVRALYEKQTSSLKKALEDERKARKELEKAEKEAAKEREKAELKALEENKEFQKLAEQRAAKIAELEKKLAELESLQANVERYQKALEAQLKAQRDGLPAHLVTLLDKLDPVEQLEYLAANREALGGGESGKKPPPGVPPNPPLGGKEPSPEDKEKALDGFSQVYRSF